jgi:hypothetical protein
VEGKELGWVGRRAQPDCACTGTRAITNSPMVVLCYAVLQRVSDVYEQQCREVQDPQLPADTATQLVGHMLALQAEGLTAAQVRTSEVYPSCFESEEAHCLHSGRGAVRQGSAVPVPTCCMAPTDCCILAWPADTAGGPDAGDAGRAQHHARSHCCVH